MHHNSYRLKDWFELLLDKISEWFEKKFKRR